MKPSELTLKFGIWTSAIGILMGAIYLVALAAAAVSPMGFPPVEPYDTLISAITLISASGILVLFAVIDVYVQGERQVFGRIALVFATLFAGMTSINRFVHLAVVRPALAAGQTAGLEWFLPYGSPSVMLGLELLAWSFFLGLAFLFAAPVFAGRRLERALFWVAFINGILCLISTLTPLTGIVLFTFMGVLAWGPGFILFCALLILMFRNKLVEL